MVETKRQTVSATILAVGWLKKRNAKLCAVENKTTDAMQAAMPFNARKKDRPPPKAELKIHAPRIPVATGARMEKHIPMQNERHRAPEAKGDLAWAEQEPSS